ncbi:MAG: hypothetical protein ACJ77K_04955 [Bacteroidia bacterium]
MKEIEHANAAAPRPVFGDNFNSFLFKTNITVYGKDFSGLLVTKQMSPNDYRVIFTTELGMKLFDFEFKDTSFTLHYCVPQFNKPKLLKVIQQDIETLLMNDLVNKSYEYYSDKAGIYNIHRFDRGKFSNYYFTEKASKQLLKIEHAKKRIKKTTFTLSDYENNIPGKILIRHHDIKLRIELNLLKNKSVTEQ